MNTETITCQAGCGASFFLVSARGDRAHYCLDCAPLVRGEFDGHWVENS